MMPYPQAVQNITSEIRDEFVSSLVHLIDLFGTSGPPSAAEELWRMVDMMQVRCSELCSAGLDYEKAETFIRTQSPTEAGRWLADQLF